MTGKIFISSTCYDLIDLRTELENEIKMIGLTPVLSDRATSDFAASTDANSIESCLINLKTCDCVLLILSQRYGPSLKSAGFDDISATHLEYRTAVENKIPIRVYVRDRLEADLHIYNKNSADPSLLKWVNSKDLKIFEIINEHRQLENSQKNNWFWTFRDSVELKTIVRKDLKRFSGQAILTKLLESGSAPHLTIEVGTRIQSGDHINLNLNVRNIGSTPAIETALLYYNDLTLEEYNGNTEEENLKFSKNLAIHSILPSESQIVPVSLHVPTLRRKGDNIEVPIALLYTTIHGHVICDLSKFMIDFQGERTILKVMSRFAEKKYLHSDGIKIHSR